MPLVSAQDLLQHAYQNQYAVAGIGITDFEMAQAALSAASQSRAPIILNLVSHHQEYVQLSNLMPSLLQMAQESDIPVAIHYDHATTLDEIKRAIALGCNSVMFEPQTDNLLDSMQQVSDLRQTCSDLGIALEAVAGHVSENNEFTPVLSPDLLTQPATTKYLADKVKPHAIAIAIGNQHGYITKAPKIDFNRLKRIHSETQRPLVVHGGSGLTEDQCLRLSRKGIAKINFFSDLAHTLVNQRKKSSDYFESLEQVQQSLMTQLNGIMLLVGSAGRAAEILQQSQAWQPTVILVSAQTQNWSDSALQQTQTRLNALTQALPSIMSKQHFIEVIDDQGLSQRREWLFTLNQQPGLVWLQTLPEFNNLIQTLRSVAFEVRVCQAESVK